jgi:hypothetical protein
MNVRATLQNGRTVKENGRRNVAYTFFGPFCRITGQNSERSFWFTFIISLGKTDSWSYVRICSCVFILYVLDTLTFYLHFRLTRLKSIQNSYIECCVVQRTISKKFGSPSNYLKWTSHVVAYNWKCLLGVVSDYIQRPGRWFALTQILNISMLCISWSIFKVVLLVPLTLQGCVVK